MGVCDLVRLLWSKADVYDLVHTPQQVLYNMAPIWYWVSPIWSDLVIRVTPAQPHYPTAVIFTDRSS